jgi:DNA-binding response OmpR family regulator
MAAPDHLPPLALIVDDDPDVGPLLRRALTSWLPAWAVALVSSGRAALQAVAERPAALVVADYQLPDLDGLQLAAAIKAASPATRIMLISGLASLLEADQISSAGIDYVLAKPFTLTKLEAAVRSLLAS